MLVSACSVAEKQEAKPLLIKTSTTSHIKEKESYFADLNNIYKNKDAIKAARDNLKAGSNVVKVFYAGRGGVVIPEFNDAPNNCLQESVEGMGDVIYGEQHMKYRQLMREYAKQYNLVMKAYCK